MFWNKEFTFQMIKDNIHRAHFDSYFTEVLLQLWILCILRTVWRTMTAAVVCSLCYFNRNSHWSKIALSGLNYKTRNLWHIYTWSPLLSQWKLLLKDQRSCLYSWQSENILLGYLPRRSHLLQVRKRVCLSTYSSMFPTGGAVWGGVPGPLWWHTSLPALL